MAKYLSELFEEEPEKYGLRGDPYLWDYYKQFFSDIEFPYSEVAFCDDMYTLFEEVTGEQLEPDIKIYVNAFAGNGMSSGYVSGEFWSNEAIPMLVKRYRDMVGDSISHEQDDTKKSNSNVKSKKYIYYMLAYVLVGLSLCSINPYKYFYQKEEKVMNREATTVDVGYPAGDDIPVYHSIAEIKENPYEPFTIEVSKEDVVPTRYFYIKDLSESKDSSSKVGRHYTYQYVPKIIVMGQGVIGDVRYATRRFWWNLDNTSYGEYCVITLESGEKILAWLDISLLDFPKEGTIRLPIAEYDRNDSFFPIKGMDEDGAIFGLEDENTDWCIDMVGDWEEREVGDIKLGNLFWAMVILAFPLGFYWLYKYAVANGY